MPFRIFLTILIISFPIASWATTEQYLLFSSANELTSASNRWHPVMGNGQITSNNNNAECIDAVGGTISDLKVWIDTASAATKDWTFTLQENGSDAAVTCTILGGSKTCEDITHSEVIDAGDPISIRSNGVAVITNTYVHFSMKYTGDGSYFCGSTAERNLQSETTNYISLAGPNYNDQEATLAKSQIVVPTSGSFSNMYVALDGNPGAAPNSYTFTLLKNGSATAQTCSIDNNSNPTWSSFGCTASGEAAVAVSAGDRVVIQVFPDDSPATQEARLGIQFTATDPTQSFFPASSSDFTTSPLDDTSTEYQSLFAAKPIPGAETTTNVQYIGTALSDTITFKNIYAYTIDDPVNGGGSADYYTFTLRNSTTIPGTNESITCNVLGGSQACNASADVVVTAGNRFITEIVPVSTPTITNAIISYLYEVTSSAARRIFVID